jgi:hypothetical protein
VGRSGSQSSPNRTEGLRLLYGIGDLAVLVRLTDSVPTRLFSLAFFDEERRVGSLLALPLCTVVTVDSDKPVMGTLNRGDSYNTRTETQ